MEILAVIIVLIILIIPAYYIIKFVILIFSGLLSKKDCSACSCKDNYHLDKFNDSESHCKKG